MKERPILFSAPMVRALLAGTKTQTRREVKTGAMLGGWETGHNARGDITSRWPLGRGLKPSACPYGQPGDRLWVRETYFAWGRWGKRFSSAKGRDEWHFIDMTADSGNSYLYAADGVRNTWMFVKRRGDPLPMYWQRPSIHMPRSASRITLEVTGVRVERLQEISEADAVAEGVEVPPTPSEYRDACGELVLPSRRTARDAYRVLWEEINGPGSWDEDPWVWVVGFKLLKGGG